MIPERVCKTYNFIKERRIKEIALRFLAVPVLIAMVNVLDEKINVQQEALKAWKQTTGVAQMVEASGLEENSREKSGVIFQAEEVDQALIILDAVDESVMQQAIETIKAEGGHIVHVFPTHVLIGSLPQGHEAALLGQVGIVSVYRDLLDSSTVAAYGQAARQAVEIWNTTFASQQPQSSVLSTQEVGEELVNDAFYPPDLSQELQVITESDVTSEFMIGRVAVGIVLPESDGSIDPSTEDWTGEEQIRVLSKIVVGMDWWAARERRANLVYFYDANILPTDYEPINRPQIDQGLWIDQVMERLGYSTPFYFTRVRDYNNALRSQYDTDWAFTIFVADSSNDDDNKFPDGRFAYAYFGGPFMVMTLGNNGYGLDNMDGVAAHEVGHIFRALDQYYSAYQPCTCRSGYLQVENQNSQYGDCLSNEPSIMRGGTWPYQLGAVDRYARGQIGWWDLDGDNILDPVDPEIRRAFLYPYAPDPATNDSISYRGLAIATTGVTSVDYRVDIPGIWLPAYAIEGAFNEKVEPFEFTALGVPLGLRVFQARVTDSEGRIQEEPYGSDELTVFRSAIWLPIIVKGYH